MQKQKSPALVSLITGILFLFFSLFHSTILASVAMPGHHSGHSNTQYGTSAISCIQQCTVVKSGNKPQHEQKKEVDPIKPFESLLASISLVTGVLYLMPHALLFIKRRLKVPIYKQVACYRI